MEFDKPSLSIEQQLELLISRCLIVSDKSKAKRYLEHIGYYRLSAYMIPFYTHVKEHKFKANTTFEDILNLYIFDRKLRLLILEAVERIEISFRSAFINIFAQLKGSHGYLEEKFFDTRYDNQWLIEKLQKEVRKSKEVFVQHYKNKYDDSNLPPVWMSTHLITFKELVVLYQNIRDIDITQQMASFYGLKNPIIISWMRTLSDLRNLCAHHSRVWNRSFGQKGVLPKNMPKKWLENFPELINIGNNDKISPRNSLYFHIVIIWYFMSQMNTNSIWLDRLIKLCDKHSINMINLGFPENWQQDKYWDLATCDKGAKPCN